MKYTYTHPSKCHFKIGRRTAWIEIKLVDESGKAVAEEPYWIKAPGEEVYEGKLDENGLVRIENLFPGNCVIKFPEIDENDWKLPLNPDPPPLEEEPEIPVVEGAEFAPEEEPEQEMIPPTQFFGTDAGDIEPEKQKSIFESAIRSGYRSFDTAYYYRTKEEIDQNRPRTLKNLWTAVGKQNILPEQIILIYKVLKSLEPDDNIEQRLDTELQEALECTGNQKKPFDILMLHEVDINPEKCLKALSKAVDDHFAKAIGVSNVSTIENDPANLAEIMNYAKSPIKYVENRFSPYLQDENVRQYCRKNNIVYLGYGLFGDAYSGDCLNEGAGNPRIFLRPLYDTRLIKLAKEANLNVFQLIYLWAKRKGVRCITFSRREEGQKENLKTMDADIADDTFEKMENMVTRIPAQDKEFLKDLDVSLQNLYLSYEDPTFWHIISELIKDDKVKELLQAVSRDLGSRENRENFLFHLASIAGDIQQSGAKEKYCETMRTTFITHAKRPKIYTSEDFIYNNFLKWAKRPGGKTQPVHDPKTVYNRLNKVFSGPSKRTVFLNVGLDLTNDDNEKCDAVYGKAMEKGVVLYSGGECEKCGKNFRDTPAIENCPDCTVPVLDRKTIKFEYQFAQAQEGIEAEIIKNIQAEWKKAEVVKRIDE